MKLTGNTIFITGGGSGIGRGLAEALHRNGNKVIIAGRRKGQLQQVLDANPGMASFELDIRDPASIGAVANDLLTQFPTLNVLINNAGIMKMDDLSGVLDETVLTSTIETNLYGPMRMTSALIEHLKQQPDATVINVSSGLAFVPLALTAVYCTTKAALHSYSLSLRYRLKNTGVKVLELAPPYVQTDLLNGADDPRAMPLGEFITETMQLLGTDAEEILVERVRGMRSNPGPDEGVFVNQMNDGFMASSH